MILSMTGFGSATAEYLNKKFTVEVKSLNSKQLDLTLRLPQGYRQAEAEVRAIVAPRLERGKSELSAFVETTSGEASARLNLEAMADYRRQIIEASAKLGIPEPTDWYGVLMRMPDVIKAETPVEAAEPEKEVLLACVNEAVEGLMEHRAAEGRRRVLPPAYQPHLRPARRSATLRDRTNHQDTLPHHRQPVIHPQGGL